MKGRSTKILAERGFFSGLTYWIGTFQEQEVGPKWGFSGWQAFLQKKVSGKLGEESGPPVVMVEEAFERPVLKGPGGVKGFHGGQSGSRIGSDFALARVGGAERSGKGAGNGGTGHAGADLGKESPGTVEKQEGKAGIGSTEGRRPDLEKNESGGVKRECWRGHEKAQVLAAAQGFEGALCFAFLRMTDNDVLQHLSYGGPASARGDG